MLSYMLKMNCLYLCASVNVRGCAFEWLLSMDEKVLHVIFV